ncbi:hypothetical protein PV328_012382 [Microctonus aethiopoides]|uniref:Uncharacterized protein n=1 Tax=Microctonus aethiopoides TaxID=144406 RepID=A0AA39EWH6_9HYME|nr:hypothetical protein PV328_012382 [Microctonus aethiopoides]
MADPNLALDNEDEPQGRSYVWRLNRVEVEEELDRYHIPYEPNMNVQNLKKILSNFLKQAQSARASQASDNEEEEEELPVHVEPNVEIRRADNDEIRSAPVSRPVTPVRPYAPTLTLEAVRAELLNFREQMFDDFQHQFAIRENPEPQRRVNPIRQPQINPERELPRPSQAQHRIEDDLFVTSQVRRWDATKTTSQPYSFKFETGI